MGADTERLPERATRAGLLIVLALALAGLLVQYLRFVHDYEYLWGLAPLFNPAREGNVPTWFSSALLLLSGTALAIAGARLREVSARGARWWLVLAAVFVLASLDETANLHELLSQQARRHFHPGFGQLWVLVLGPAALAFMAAYAGFLRRQAPPVRRAFALGAALFVGGALGVEVLEIVAERAGAGPLTVAVVTVGQEILELLGAVVLLRGSLSLLVAH